MGWRYFVYYTLIKHGKILIAILGLILAIIVFMYAQKFGMGYNQATSTAYTVCDTNYDCFEWCGKCVSTAGTRICEPNETIVCGCANGRCAVT